jgi:hypothetical protein
MCMSTGVSESLAAGLLYVILLLAHYKGDA